MTDLYVENAGGILPAAQVMFVDNDSNNDGIPDAEDDRTTTGSRTTRIADFLGIDTDDDGIPDIEDDDIDGNGVLNEDEDDDGDGVTNRDDDDDDGDGILDIDEEDDNARRLRRPDVLPGRASRTRRCARSGRRKRSTDRRGARSRNGQRRLPHDRRTLTEVRTRMCQTTRAARHARRHAARAHGRRRWSSACSA